MTPPSGIPEPRLPAIVAPPVTVDVEADQRQAQLRTVGGQEHLLAAVDELQLRACGPATHIAAWPAHADVAPRPARQAPEDLGGCSRRQRLDERITHIRPSPEIRAPDHITGSGHGSARERGGANDGGNKTQGAETHDLILGLRLLHPTG